MGGGKEREEGEKEREVWEGELSEGRYGGKGGEERGDRGRGETEAWQGWKGEYLYAFDWHIYQ